LNLFILKFIFTFNFTK